MNEVAAQAFVFFLAGFETSASTMQFCLYELAIHPEIQERVRDNIDTVLARHNGKLTYEAVQEMDYLERVISETLRKYPPVAVIIRECTKDYVIPGTKDVIEKGVLVFIPAYAIQRDQKHYPKPETFDPDRFLEEEKSKRHHYVYLPFGEGPRVCIGMRFGLLQTKIGLISILSNYRLFPTNETPIPIVLDPRAILTSPKGDMHLRIRNRNDRR